MHGEIDHVFAPVTVFFADPARLRADYSVTRAARFVKRKTKNFCMNLKYFVDPRTPFLIV
jgi:hypothetical protein